MADVVIFLELVDTADRPPISPPVESLERRRFTPPSLSTGGDLALRLSGSRSGATAGCSGAGESREGSILTETGSEGRSATTDIAGGGVAGSAEDSVDPLSTAKRQT
jgi:hypothetical protein